MIGRRVADPADGSTPPRVHTARAELTLARPDQHPLRDVPLRPDPITVFVRALGEVRDDLGESAEICLDLLPLTPAQRRHRRRRLLREASPAGGLRARLQQLAGNLGGSPAGPRRPPAGTAQAAEARSTGRELNDKLLSPEPMFAVQCLIRVQSQVPGRAEAHLHAILAGFSQFTGANYWRACGINLGFLHLGADAPWRRAEFDRRLESGRFRPRRRAVVTAREIAAFLKPPTRHCHSTAAARSGGVIPPPPRELPTYRKQPDLLPIGKVVGDDGLRPVGVPIAESLFGLVTGRAGFGKTEGAICKFIAVTRAGYGGMYLDPHADALERMKPYIVDLADRVLEINLQPGQSRREPMQAGWNLLSMEGRSAADIEARVSAVVDSFASALRWGEINNRALTLTTMAAQSLCELALKLPAELAPTLFQMTTLMSDEDWRGLVIPHLSPATAAFWSQRFTRLSAESITPVTNLLDRLRSSPTVAALLGSSRSTYDVRRAMDAGQIVLVCPAGTGDKDRLLANFFFYDLLQAALSRRDLPRERRRPFFAFPDELQTADSPNLAGILQETRKFGLRLFGATQQPDRLSKSTLDAFMTNQSHLATFIVGAGSAKLLSKEWGNAVAPETITRLEKYTAITSVTIGGRVTPPFLVHGWEIGELWGEHYNPDGVPAMDEAIDANLHRRPVTETLADLASLDERIADHLCGSARLPDPPPRGTAPAPPDPAPTPSAPDTSPAPLPDGVASLEAFRSHVRTGGRPR